MHHDILECFNENKCAIFFYITHLSVQYFGVQYEIYPAHFPFDLRCQSGILYYIIKYLIVGIDKEYMASHV